METAISQMVNANATQDLKEIYVKKRNAKIIVQVMENALNKDNVYVISNTLEKIAAKKYVRTIAIVIKV
jgi:hypothetical protein